MNHRTRFVTTGLIALACPIDAVAAESPAAVAASSDAMARPGPSPYGIVVPLPLLVVFGRAGLRDIPVGLGTLQVEARGGYGWRTEAIYRTDVPALSEIAPLQPANVYGGSLQSRWFFLPNGSLVLTGGLNGGGPQNTATYDPTLTGGLSGYVGPSLRFSTLNNTAFPTAGTLVETGWEAGHYWGTDSFTFQRGWLQGQHFIDFGADRTLAFRVIVQAAWPRLAWVDKYGSGAVTAVRGYAWGRFTGDRHVVATAEYRHLPFPKLVSFWGLDIGLGWSAFVDVGRAWESTAGIPFPSDIRPGAGAGAFLTLNRNVVGGYALSVGNEGLNIFGFLGNSF
jgi:hypothetical protein